VLGLVSHAIDSRWSYLVCLPLVSASLFAVRALPSRAAALAPGELLTEPLSPNG
jgi:hypothetical protein